MNRREFMGQSAVAAISLVASKWLKIENRQNVPVKSIESDIFKYTAEEEQIMYDYCECGAYQVQAKDGILSCCGCGETDLSNRSTLAIDVLSRWAQEDAKRDKAWIFSIRKSPQTPTMKAIMLAQWEKWRAYHLMHGTFNKDAQFAYQVHKRVFSDT